MIGASALARLRKLRGRSLAELQERGVQAASVLLERVGTGKRREPTEAEFRRWLREGSTLDLQGFPRPDDLARAADLALRKKMSWVGMTIEAASKVMRGEFDLLGYDGLSFGEPVDWHLDPVSGRAAPRTHWSRIPFLDAGQTGDHKVVWEINRHHHLVLLGRAYALTRDETNAVHAARQLSEWMDENSPKTGINWVSSLEVSYRLIAWIWCLRFFARSPSFTGDLRRRILKFAHVHASHVETYLSTYFSPNTHLTGEALGLWYAGNAMPFFRRAERWKRRGWSILERQITKQVFADGVYFEQASYYQRYTIDIYTHAMMVAKASAHQVPPAMLSAVEAMSVFLARISRPDGTIPLVGDDDGGQLVRLEERQCANGRAAFASTAILSRNAWFKHLAGPLPEESLWLFGVDGAEWYEQAVEGAAPPATALHAQGGYAVMRNGWARDSSVTVVDCGPLGMANGGHGHADSLAILITVGGRPLFVDRGTFTYTADLAARNRFRESQSHNTVSVDDTSSSVPAGPFTWKNMAAVSVNAFRDAETACFFAGEHDGYVGMDDPVRHERRVLFLKQAKVWLVWDIVQGSSEHLATAVFQCAPDLQAAARTPGVVDFFADGNALASMTGIADGGCIEVATSTVSDCYGSQHPAAACRAFSRKKGRHDLVFVIAAAEQGRLPTVSATQGAASISIELRCLDSVHRLHLDTRGISQRTETAGGGVLTWETGSTEDDLRLAGHWNTNE